MRGDIRSLITALEDENQRLKGMRDARKELEQDSGSESSASLGASGGGPAVKDKRDKNLRVQKPVQLENVALLTVGADNGSVLTKIHNVLRWARGAWLAFTGFFLAFAVTLLPALVVTRASAPLWVNFVRAVSPLKYAENLIQQWVDHVPIDNAMVGESLRWPDQYDVAVALVPGCVVFLFCMCLRSLAATCNVCYPALHASQYRVVDGEFCHPTHVLETFAVGESLPSDPADLRQDGHSISDVKYVDPQVRKVFYQQSAVELRSDLISGPVLLRSVVLAERTLYVSAEMVSHACALRVLDPGAGLEVMRSRVYAYMASQQHTNFDRTSATGMFVVADTASFVLALGLQRQQRQPFRFAAAALP